MSNITVSTTQSVIAVTQTGGITVTTPEGQTIAVTVPNSSVNVTNTTDDITIAQIGVTNTDQLIEGTTNLFFTNARARAAISLTTDDSSILSYNSSTGVFTWNTPTTTKIAEGTNLYYTTARANTDFDTRLATKTTTNLAEGTNLYYTTARANTDFDTRLATKTTTNLAEGTNQYFTTARARQSLSAGTGISYDSGTGVITNTSINTDTTYTINASTTAGGANLNLAGSDSTTDSVKFLGSGATTITRTDADTITVSSTDANTTYTQNISSTTGGANLNLVGSDSTTDTVKFASGTGVTVAYTDANTATVSIGQSVATSDDVTFGSVIIDGVITLNTATTTTTSLTPTNISSTTRTAQKVVITVKDNVTGEIHTLEALAFMKGTTAYLTTYAEMYSNLALATFTADVDAGTVRILATPASTNSTTFKVARISVD